LRRALLAILGTAAGTTLLVGVKAGMSPQNGAEAIAGTNVNPGTGESAATPGSPQSRARATPKPRQSSRANAQPGPKAGTYPGTVAQTEYGPVQVRVVVAGGRITDVTALQLPGGAARSEQISKRAGPLLRLGALKAQSAEIDTVSGATYTSDGYRRSLQAALDAAKG
jgi:uncharacterized protein with FMN-binding domain